MTDNLNNYEYQSNEAINSEPKFDNSSFNLSSGTSDLIPVVNVSLRGGEKHRARIIAGITCLWNSVATDNMIEIQHTKHYERKMRSDRVEYNTANGVYYTTHDFKVSFCIPEFSSSKIINHRFHVDKDEGESGIGYDMIIGHDLMVKLGLTANFKCQVLQWYGATVHMKESRKFLGQSDLTKRNMREVVMHTAETASTREGIE